MKSLSILVIIMSLIVTSCASDKKEKKKSSSPGVSYVGGQTDSTVSNEPMQAKQIEKITANWSPESKTLLTELIGKYGQPQEANEREAVWYNNGQWSKTVLKGQFDENVLSQSVSMQVPPERLGEVAMYNKNITVDQAQEEVTTSSNKEEMNFLSLNLAKDVIDGKVSPYEARRQFSTIQNSMTQNNYLQGLNFGLPAPTKQSQEALE